MSYWYETNKKVVWALIGALVIAGIAVMMILSTRQASESEEERETYAGNYVEREEGSSVGHRLTLRADGTWTEYKRAGENVYRDGGDPADEFTGGAGAAEDLIWLGPEDTTDCIETYGDPDAELCSSRPKKAWQGEKLIWVPWERVQTSNKGDFSVSGDLYLVAEGGEVLVDEFGTRWKRTEP